MQLAIGQGLLSASPLQLATGYATIANGGFVLRPEIVKAIYEPGVPDAARPAMPTSSQARFAEEPNTRGDLVRQIPMTEEIRGEINRGLRRVITGPGTVSDYYHSTTGEKLFYTYPSEAIPVAGKTGTAQGAGNYPWNDSSAFAAYSIDPRTSLHGRRRTSRRADTAPRRRAPVVKCMFLQLSGIAPADPVELSDPLDTTELDSGGVQALADQSCYAGRFSPTRGTE